MGINLEFAELLYRLSDRNEFDGARSVIELGAQDLTIKRSVLHAHLEKWGRGSKSTPDSLDIVGLYRAFGFTEYAAIDANGENGAKVFDLNRDLGTDYGFNETFDLVTNLGTAEHCFNQEQVFANIHKLCATGGLMIHALPAQGSINHGFYAYNPKLFRDLAGANAYNILELSFTANKAPRLIDYTLANLRRHRGKDVLLYVVMRKTRDAKFERPFDGDFADDNRLDDYTKITTMEGGPALEEYRNSDLSPYYIARSGRRSRAHEFAYAVRDTFRMLRRYLDRKN